MKTKSKWYVGILLAVLFVVVFSLMATTVVQPQSAKALVAPELNGLRISYAKTEMAKSDIEFELLYQQSEEPEGIVLKQEPDPGTEMKAGQKIRLYVAIPITKGGKTSLPPPTSAPVVQQPAQQNNGGSSTKQSTQKTKAQIDAERKAEIDRLKAEAKAAADAAQQKLAEEQARLAADQARRDALYNTMLAAQSETSSARYALDRAVASVNDFAARGMLQSGAGNQASAERDAAQIRYNNAIVAEQSATEAWNSR